MLLLLHFPTCVIYLPCGNHFPLRNQFPCIKLSNYSFKHFISNPRNQCQVLCKYWIKNQLLRGLNKILRVMLTFCKSLDPVTFFGKPRMSKMIGRWRCRLHPWDHEMSAFTNNKGSDSCNIRT